MSQTTRSLSASFALTTSSADNSITRGEHARTATQEEAPCSVVTVDLSTKGLPAGHREIDDIVAESERNPERKAALEEARQWAAETFYKDERSLRAMRLKKGLSQSRLASLIGTTQSHIARVESGQSDVQVSTLERVAEALGEEPLQIVDVFLRMRRKAVAMQTDE